MCWRAIVRSYTLTSALFLASSARNSLGVKLLSARLIWGSSREVTKSLSHDGSRESWLAMTSSSGFCDSLCSSSSARARVEDDEQRPLGRLDLRDKQRRLEERLEELRGVVHRFPWHPLGLKLLLVAREPVCEHGGQAAEQRAGRRLRRVIVAAKVPGDGMVDDTV